MRLSLCALLFAAGCLSVPGELPTCDAGCDAPRVCHKGYCLIPDEPNPDAGFVDAGPALPPDAGPPVNPATCGNAVVERGEDCDDGNQENTDACTSACRWRLQAAGGIGHSCFRKGTSLYCTGVNLKGQIGDDTTTDRQVPTRVVNASPFVDVALLAQATCALSETGTVECWGHCADGVLGPNHPLEAGEGCDQKTPQSVPEPFARCPKGVLGYLQILGSGDVGSARTEGHCLFSFRPLYLLLVYAVVRAADTLTVIAIALLLRSGHPLLFGPVWQPVHPATRLPADDDPIAIGECRFQFGRGILPTLGYFVRLSTPPPNRKRFIFLNVT